jgi:hypothetical protein
MKLAEIANQTAELKEKILAEKARVETLATAVMRAYKARTGQRVYGNAELGCVRINQDVYRETPHAYIWFSRCDKLPPAHKTWRGHWDVYREIYADLCRIDVASFEAAMSAAIVKSQS